MQRPGQTTTPSQTLCARINNNPPDLLNLPLYVIDHPDTKLHDDAIGWINTGDGFRIYTAITAAGLQTRFVTKHLPKKCTVALKKKHRNKHSLGGRNQAVTLSYWTNGQEIQDPQLSFQEIQSRRYTHQTLPDQLKEELFQITNKPRSQASIEVFMSNYNTILAHTAAKKGISIPYYNKTRGQKSYSAEPTKHEHLGTIYTRSTNPLRSQVDLITNLQVAKLLSGKGTPRNKRTINQYLTYLNNQQAA